jgi:extradiol dioxygenase family protein
MESSSSPLVPFHLAIPVHDIEAAREFYIGKMGCTEGRSSERWVDFSFFGHQLVAHKVDGYVASRAENNVDNDPVPIPHFGTCLSIASFHELAARLRDKGVEFVIEPHLRFRSTPGEQWTMFMRDQSGNAIEIKALTTPSNLFAKYTVS